MGYSNPGTVEQTLSTPAREDVLGYAVTLSAKDFRANAKHITNTNSGHEIHMEQSRLVIAAVREVVNGCVIGPMAAWRC
jgi:hypothetical protein